MPLGRTFTGQPGQPSSSTGGPTEIKADLDAIIKALNDAFGILGITLASNGTPDASGKTFPLDVDLASIVLGVSGSELVGYPDAVDNNVYKIIQRILSAGTGAIPPDNSITNAKLVNDIKVGSLLTVNTTDKTSVVNALNEVIGDLGNVSSDLSTLDGDVSTLTSTVNQISENLNISRTSKDSTGSTNTYIVDTDGTFDFTKDGNILPFNPSFTCTGTSTIEVDGTSRVIKKYNIDTGAFVNLEANDIKKYNQLDLRYDVSEGFFVLAPRGGAVRIQNENMVAKVGTVTRTQADGVGTSTATAITLPASCKVFHFIDRMLNGGAFSNSPYSLLKVNKNTSIGPGVTAELKLYSASDVLIGTLATLTKAAGFTGTEYLYIQNIDLVQVGAQIRATINTIPSPTNISAIATSLLTGDLSGAKLKVEATIYGSAVGTITINSVLDGNASTYSN